MTGSPENNQHKSAVVKHSYFLDWEDLQRTICLFCDLLPFCPFQKKYDEEVHGGRFNEGFADLDEYGFTLKRRDTSGDITFKPAESSSGGAAGAKAADEISAFGDIKTDHVVEIYEPEGEVSEDKETGEKDVVRKQSDSKDKTSHVQVYDVTAPALRSSTGIGNGARNRSPDRLDESSVKGDDSRSTEEQEMPPDAKDKASDSTTDLQSRLSMDLDELYKDTHLPEKEKPEKKAKKKEKKKEKKTRNDDVDASQPSPFVRSFRPSGAPVSTPTGDGHQAGDHTGSNQPMSNGFLPNESKDATKESGSTPLPYNPDNVTMDMANLDEDLQQITTQIFQSNVPRLSAHKLAILGQFNRSSKYKRGPPVERRIIRNSLRESKELQRKQIAEFSKILHPTQDVLPAWAKRNTEDKTLKFMLIGVIVFLVVAAICVPLVWKMCEFQPQVFFNLLSLYAPRNPRSRETFRDMHCVKS